MSYAPPSSNASLIRGKLVDDTAIGDGKVLAYDADTGTIVYAADSTVSLPIAQSDVTGLVNALEAEQDARITLTGTVTTHVGATSVHGATSSATASRLVLRDASGNFAAGTITVNAVKSSGTLTVGGDFVITQGEGATFSNALNAPIFNGVDISLTNGDLIVQGGDVQADEVRSTGNMSATGNVTAANLIKAVGVWIDGNGGVITTGSKGTKYMETSGTIVGVTIISDVTGSCVIDIKKGTSGSFPTNSSIVASAPPTLSSARLSTSTALTGWTTAITAGDVLEFSVTSATSVKRVTLTLSVKQ